jgi:uncharacterized membrane protein YcgQ (UPF0703/DUF1980 family)
MAGIGINIFHLLFVGPLLFLLGYVNLPGANSKVINVMRSSYLSYALIVIAFVLMITHTVKVTKKTMSGFIIGDNRRLTNEQYDNTKLMSTQGRLQESREMLAKAGYPFSGLEKHETHLKENFISQNLPLWTEK